ncbi:MAG: hypothetical protein JST04_11925 [Bdellovibrionales bacterium]|nr:hypothetical protein [Bdellovibrionales bacterium]
MRSKFPGSAIFLTLVFLLGQAGFARADGEVTSCKKPDSGLSGDLSWLSDLQAALKGDGTTKTPSKLGQDDGKTVVKEEPSPFPSPLVDEDEIDQKVTKKKVSTTPDFGSVEKDDDPSSTYDLQDPALTQLRRKARYEATRCRVRKGRTICGNHSKYLCYAAVKDTILDMKWVKARWSQEAASDAHDRGTLTGLGFKNVMGERTSGGAPFNSSNAPLGAVLVYRGGSGRNCPGSAQGNSYCGHIEIKLNKSEYCSDFCSPLPIDKSGLKRTLVGIYVKE